MKRILITGGAGFIGSHLCRKLLNEENEVICLDNLFTGSLDNIRDLCGNKYFRFVNHDIVNEYETKADEIYNLACPASPPHYQYNPVKTLKTSVLGAINMLELSKKCGAKILQASTSEVYGDPAVHPQRESYWGNVNPVGARSCYDEGKRCAETLMSDYGRQENVRTKIVRIFNTYGPNMALDDGRVVSNFVIQALKNEDITIYGDGSQTRSFCYVDDLIRGLVKMMDSACSGPINLGNPSEMTISGFAELVIKLTRSKSKIIHKQLPSDDPKRRQPDITLAQKELDWKPKVDIAEGLEKTVEYFRKVI